VATTVVRDVTTDLAVAPVDPRRGSASAVAA
jgi:hypothetical protein